MIKGSDRFTVTLIQRMHIGLATEPAAMPGSYITFDAALSAIRYPVALRRDPALFCIGRRCMHDAPRVPPVVHRMTSLFGVSASCVRVDGHALT
jgi:hypothetical protein